MITYPPDKWLIGFYISIPNDQPSAPLGHPIEDHQRMDLPRFHLKSHMIQSLHARKGLGDLSHFQ